MLPPLMVVLSPMDALEKSVVEAKGEAQPAEGKPQKQSGPQESSRERTGSRQDG